MVGKRWRSDGLMAGGAGDARHGSGARGETRPAGTASADRGSSFTTAWAVSGAETERSRMAAASRAAPARGERRGEEVAAHSGASRWFG